MKQILKIIIIAIVAIVAILAVYIGIMAVYYHNMINEPHLNITKLSKYLEENSSRSLNDPLTPELWDKLKSD